MDIKEILDNAAEMYPYKVVGNPDTYSDYNQGWADAIEYVASMLLKEQKGCSI